LEILAREEQLLVGLHGVGAQRGAGQVDELGLEFLLRRGEQPLGVVLEADAPELLGAPFLHLGHVSLFALMCGLSCWRRSHSGRSVELSPDDRPRWLRGDATVAGPPPTAAVPI